MTRRRQLFGIFGFAVALVATGSTAALAQCEQAKLTASDAAQEDVFGRSVAISGDYLVVGAPSREVSAPGAAYVFRRVGSAWVEQMKLTAGDAQPGARFGLSVSIDGDAVVVGAYDAEEAGIRSGAIYVFRRSGTDWVQEAKLVPSDAAEEDFFGFSVAIRADVAIVGAPWDDDAFPDDPSCGSGSAYVFARNGASWVEQAKLTASDQDCGHQFGRSVSIDGDYALVGSAFATTVPPFTGSAYVFERTGADWVEQARFTLDDPRSGDIFGGSVAIADDVAVVGAINVTPPPSSASTASQGARSNDSYSGSAFVFTRNETTWTQEVKLTPSDGVSSDYFGGSVFMRGDRLAVGASGHDEAIEDAGAVYLFRRFGTSWVEDGKVTASDAGWRDRFGGAVSLDGDYIVVGAHQDDDVCPSGDPSCDSGSAYVYAVPECVTPIPTISAWGLMVMLLLLLGVGAVVIARRAPTRG